MLKIIRVLLSHLFSELQQSSVYLIMGTEGVPRTLELSRKCQRISLCLGSGHPAGICFADISNEVTATEMALKISQHPANCPVFVSQCTMIRDCKS